MAFDLTFVKSDLLKLTNLRSLTLEKQGGHVNGGVQIPPNITKYGISFAISNN